MKTAPTTPINRLNRAHHHPVAPSPLRWVIWPLLLATAAQAQFSIDWHTIDGGGGTSTGGRFAMSGTIGQPDAGVMQDGRFSLTGGFWSEMGVGSIPNRTLLVTTTSDSGPGSLRQAILDANVDANVDASSHTVFIHFDIPGAGLRTIAPQTGLPAITRRVTIDGYTQPGARANTLNAGNDAVLRIELSGASLATTAYGLRLTADNCTVRGLIINRFSPAGSAGLVLHNAQGGTVEGNSFGTGVTGLERLPNETGIGLFGGGRHRIGGSTAASRNVVGRNVYGINLSVSTNNSILGNYIGLGADGRTVLENLYGIYLHNSHRNEVGGLTAGRRNILSGNTNGCWINGGSSNVVQGNFVGTDATGTLPRGNLFGIVVNQSIANLIGGGDAGAENLISASLLDGVILEGVSTKNNVVAGNRFGTDFTGTLALSNRNSAIVVAGASSNIIGGITAGARNVIAFSGRAGVALIQAGSTNNAIQGNHIFANGGLGIDHFADGVTVNDVGDLPPQNFPVLAAVTNTPAGLIVHGTLASRPSRSYRVEFFANPVCHASGHGEGKTWLGFASVLTEASGNAVFQALLPPIDGELFITATATDDSGNTSEFSACRLAVDRNARLSATILPVPGGQAQFSLCWLDSANVYQLEFTPSFAPPVVWQPITTGITQTANGKCYSQTITPAFPQGFYRLRWP